MAPHSLPKLVCVRVQGLLPRSKDRPTVPRVSHAHELDKHFQSGQLLYKPPVVLFLGVTGLTDSVFVKELLWWRRPSAPFFITISTAATSFSGLGARGGDVGGSAAVSGGVPLCSSGGRSCGKGGSCRDGATI